MKKIWLLGFGLLSLSIPLRAADDTADGLVCLANVIGGARLVRLADQRVLDRYVEFADCEESRLAAHGGVVCTWFTADMPVGPGGWNENGWRPTNVQTQMGLGRKPLASKKDCLDATRAANGGVVCTNTGLGAKAANITTNMWCGASSQLRYCLEATEAARNQVVCSFPSSGTGAEAGWVRTHVTATCDYQSSQMRLADCNASIPTP